MADRGGRSNDRNGALVSSLTRFRAQGGIIYVGVDILKPFFFNGRDVYTVTLVNFHLRANLCKESQQINLSKIIKKFFFFFFFRFPATSRRKEVLK